MLLRCEKKHQMGMEHEGEAKITCVVSNHSLPAPASCSMKRIFSWESGGKKRVKTSGGEKRVKDGQQQGETS
jgi:hypothetical protein